jgi:hypothetical protein
MAKRREAAVAGHSAREQEMRDQEVLRANRELAAYFKGRRTEREARAALKIIKAFVRDRERQGAKDRRPLPGVDPPTAANDPAARKHAASGTRALRKRRRAKPRTAPETANAPIESAGGNRSAESGDV